MKYIITSPKSSGEIVLEYALNGYLTHYSNSIVMSEEAFKIWFKAMPVWKDYVPKIKENVNLKHLIITEVKQDLSFTLFWETYNYKIGKKAKAEKLWNALSEADKVLVFENIKAYNYYLTIKQNQDKQYPETYLRNRT